jgi:tape measure domain-containing protein
MTGVKIRVRADSTQARRDLQRLERSVASIEKTTSNVTRGFQKLAIGITAAFTGVALTRGLSGAADSITNLENKLALVVGRGAELRTTLRSLYTISAGARLPIATATDAFNRFGLALQDSGKSTEEILRVTNAVLQSATLSGATAASANGAIMQLGQGLASGTLRGEELNSVLEGMPRLARAIAVGMGVPFGELKALAADGKLNAEAVFAAIASEAANINSEFDGLEATISGLSSVLKDEFTRALSAFDKEIKFSENLGKVIISATDGLRYFADNLSFWSTIYRARLNSITNDFIFFADDIRNLFTDNFEFDLSSITDSISDLSSRVSDLAVGAGNTISFNVQSLDLGQFIPSLNTVKTTVIDFIKEIEGWFYWLYDKVILNSWWSDLFWKGENQIGGPKFKKALDFVKTTLATWAENIGVIFSDLYTTISAKWTEILHLLTTTEVAQPGGMGSTELNAFGRGLEYVAEKAGELKLALRDAFATHKLTGSLDMDTLNFQYELTPLGKFLEMVGDAGEGIQIYLSENFSNVVDRLYSIWESGGSAVMGAVAKSPIVTGVLATAGAAGEAIKAGKFIASGFIDKLIGDAEILGGAIAVGLIAKAALGLSLKSLVLSAGALIFSGDILDSAATQASLRSIAKGIGAFIGSFFEEGGADEIGSAFVRGLRNSIMAVGEGLTEGFDGTALDSDLGNEIVGGIATLVTIAAVSGKARTLLMGAGRVVMFAMFGKGAFKGLGVALIAGIAGAFAGNAVSDAIGIEDGSFANLGVSISTAIGSYIAFGYIATKISEAIGFAVLDVRTNPAGYIAGIRALGARIGIMLAAFSSTTAIAATLGIALGAVIAAGVVKAFTSVNDRMIEEGNALKVSVGMADIVEIATGTSFLNAPISEFSNNLRESIEEGINSDLSGFSLVERVFDINDSEYSSAIDDFNNTLNSKLANSGGQLDRATERVFSELEIAFPGFVIDENAVRRQVEESTQGFGFNLEAIINVDTSRLVKAPELEFIDTSGINDSVNEVVAATERSTQEISDALLAEGPRVAGEVLASVFTRLSQSEIISDKQLTELSTASEGVDNLTSSFDRLLLKMSEVSDIGVIDVNVNNNSNDDNINSRRPLFRANGGSVYGAGGPTEDKIPAMLSNGEFVMKASAVDKLGVGFMNRINSGMAPEGFSNGGLAGQLAQIDTQIGATQQDQFEAMSRDLPGRVSAAVATLSRLYSTRADIISRMADEESGGFDPASAFDGTTSSETSGGGNDPEEKEEDDAKTLAETFAEDFKADFKSGLSQFLKTGDLKEFTLGLLDSFTSKVIDSFVEGFTESIFEGLELDSMFEGLFQGVQDWGATLGEGTVGATEGGLFGIDFSGLFESVSSFFSGIFEDFGGGGGSGGGFLSSVMGLFGGGSFLGLNDGGLVKPLNTSRTDIDSVPAMLTPGELVVPADKVGDFMNSGGSGNNQTFNINVSGDVSRQTRKEIVQMLPQIAAGVNSQNKENNYRR